MIPVRRAARAAALLALSLAGAAAGLDAARAQDAAPIASGTRLNDPKVRVDVLSLKRTEADTVTLRLTVVNDGNQSFNPSIGNIVLLDLSNRRRYGSGMTGSGCNTSAGERGTCWAMFAAPPASVRTLYVKMYEDFELIRVPLAD